LKIWNLSLTLRCPEIIAILGRWFFKIFFLFFNIVFMERCFIYLLINMNFHFFWHWLISVIVEVISSFFLLLFFLNEEHSSIITIDASIVLFNLLVFNMRLLYWQLIVMNMKILLNPLKLFYLLTNFLVFIFKSFTFLPTLLFQPSMIAIHRPRRRVLNQRILIVIFYHKPISLIIVIFWFILIPILLLPFSELAFCNKIFILFYFCEKMIILCFFLLLNFFLFWWRFVMIRGIFPIIEVSVIV